jgi:hypothetical protein
VSVYVGCWRSLAIGRLHSSWTLELGEDLVGVLGPGEQLAALVPAIAEPADRRGRQHAAGKLLSSMLLWLGLLLLDSLALLYVFAQGDDDRVLSGRVVAVMLLAGSALMVVALQIRLRLRRRRALGQVGTQMGTG